GVRPGPVAGPAGLTPARCRPGAGEARGTGRAPLANGPHLASSASAPCGTRPATTLPGIRAALRSTAWARAATPMPRAARAAPASAGEVAPSPAARARPPIQAPPAFARLKAAWLAEEAREGAEAAF